MINYAYKNYFRHNYLHAKEHLLTTPSQTDLLSPPWAK